MLNFQNIFESIPGLYLILSPDFVIVAGSDAYFQATKTKREETVDRHMFEVFPDNPDDPNADGVQNLRASLESVLEHRQSHTMAIQKYDIRRPESEGGGFEERYWSPINSPVFDQSGEIAFIIHRVENVTEFVLVQQQRNEQRQLNQALQSRTEQMEMEIYARAQELQEVNKQLQTANAGLSELDRAKTAFFNNVSHEFRTPLTLILSPLEELVNTLDERLQPDEREQLQLIQYNGLRLQKLVNTLLDFSRIEAGRVQASYEPTNLANYTAELASVFRSLIERAGMSLVIDCPPLPQPVYVDCEMWEKIVLNLMSNAFKFTFAGSITVRLQPVGNAVELSVEDTGVGIPEAELPRLFERFHRVSETRSRTYEGSGIGLALVQELVKLHGGTIRVTSQLDQGTTFSIVLPFGSAHLPQDRIQSTRTLNSTAIEAVSFVEEASRWLSEEDGGAGEANEQLLSLSSSSSSFSPLLKTARILLADDNADMRNYVKRLLSQYWDVETVSDGLEAWKVIAQRPPDLVLTDVMMPRLDGFGLLCELRANPSTREMPIILLSARAGEESRVEGLVAGADDYLIKPFSARELLARVEATLKLSKLRREALQQEQILRAASVTAQQKAEAALRHLDQLLERMSEAFIALDLDWRIIYQNPAAERINNKPRSQVLGKTLWEEWPAAVGSIFEQQYRHAVAEQVSVHFEQHYYEPPDYDVWLEVHAYPFEEGLGIFYRDISDHKIAEAALRESEQLKQRILESSKDCIKVLTLNSEIIYINTGGLCLLEVDDPSLILNTRWLDLWQGEDYENALTAITTAIAGNTGQFQGYLSTRNGTPKWWDSMITPVQNTAGQVTQLVAVSRDITKQKQAETERERLLAQEQIAREQAESANRIKDEFLAVLSHELRSPLNPILGWSKLLLQGKLDAAKTTTALATIERNARLQVQLIDDLLDISRILRGKLSLTVILVDLDTVIWAALETVRLAAEAKAIQIQTTVLPGIGIVMGDAGRLQQVVWNLLSNAVKFTPHGGQVAIALAADHNHAQIQVTDTGKGIKPDFLPYVFEHFRQEDGATNRKFGGLGLGLAIVRQIVEMHGGTVAVDSSGVGKGATFTVQIPLASHLYVSPAIKPPSGSTGNLSGIRILLVDDEVDSRELIAFVLEQAGAIVTTVTSGIEALQAFSQAVPDLIVSDIGMPEMDGYMLIRQIRSLPLDLGRQIPAIALTAYAGEFDQKLTITAGFQRHITKPINPEIVVAIIVELVSSA